MPRLGTVSACLLAGVVTLAGATQNAVTSTATVAYADDNDSVSATSSVDHPVAAPSDALEIGVEVDNPELLLDAVVPRSLNR